MSTLTLTHTWLQLQILNFLVVALLNGGRELLFAQSDLIFSTFDSQAVRLMQVALFLESWKNLSIS